MRDHTLAPGRPIAPARAIADACSAIGGASVDAVAGPRIRLGLCRLLDGRAVTWRRLRMAAPVTLVWMVLGLGHDVAQYAHASPGSRQRGKPGKLTRLR